MIAYVALNKNESNKLIFNNIKIIKPSDKEIIANISINSNYNNKKREKISKKFVKILKRKDIDTIIFEQEIIKDFKTLYDYSIHEDFKIINGNYLYENMINEILQYILNNTNNINIQQINMGIVINLLSYNRLQFIKNISTKVKGLTILTDTVSKFSNLSNEIMEDTGLCLKVTNNIKSGIKNCDIIFNFDFDLNKLIDCNYNNCILINFNNKIEKTKKSFKGIIINDLNVKIGDNEIFKYINKDKYRNIALAQSISENKDFKINCLVGTKGKIELKELENFKIIRNTKKKK